MKRYPLLFLLLGTGAALFVALLIIIIALRPARADLYLLVQFMGASGIITIAIVYMLYQRLLMNWVNSLRWALIVTVITSVVLVFINVWATARLMFINQHDLILTTALLVFGGQTAIVFGWFVSAHITHKLQTISDGIERLAQGNLAVRIPVTGSDEFSRLGAMLNWMADRLQQIEQEKSAIDQTRRDLVTSISHDLRTPLTAIQASLEAIVDEIVSDPQIIRDYVANSLSEITNLKTLIDDLFAIAQLDAGHMTLKFVQASLGDLISDSVSAMHARAQARDIVITGHIQPGIDPVTIAPDKIQRVLYNLIDNAIRHTPEAGSIILRAFPREDLVYVEVQNTGALIPAEHLPYIFNRFYRGEQSRQRDADGHRGAGLGLAIARGFVEAHGGTITVQNQPPGSVTFAFTLPRRPTTTGWAAFTAS